MRFLRPLFVGWCLVLHLQSACLPLDQILATLGLREAVHVCRCKITGLHDGGCLCPCCVDERGASTPTAERPCCRPHETTSRLSCRFVPAGCGAHEEPGLDASQVSPYLAGDSPGLAARPAAPLLVECREDPSYSVCADRPDKIPI
jgi:hypothetical protein